jgi:Ca-activated chloride channel family protein
MPRPSRVLIWAVLGSLISVSRVHTQVREEPSPNYREWLTQVEPLMTEAEYRAFERLHRDYQRQAFIRRFWQERNGFRNTWDRRRELATELFAGLQGDRARTLLLIGPPERIMADLCPELARPMETWYYPPGGDFAEGFYLIFIPKTEGASSSVHWSAENGVDSLFRPGALETTGLETLLPQLYRRCSHGREMAEAVALAVTWDQLQEERWLFPPEPADWTADIDDWTDASAAESAPLVGNLNVVFPGRHEDKTVTQLELSLPVEAASPTTDESESFQLQLAGEFLRQDRLYDRFRYRFEMPVAAATEGIIPLVLQRYLLPGEYLLILRLEDLNTGRNYRSEKPIDVPPPHRATALPSSSLAEANAVLTATDSWIKIQPLTDQLLTGKIRVRAEARGEAIAKVTFVLNGRPLMSKTRPPFSVEIDLGRAPRLHTLEAVAYDASGGELARDLVPVNAGPHRFGVRLLEPRAHQAYVQSLRAAAEVDLPAGETLERVDFYLNEERLASLFQPPYVQPIPLPQHRRITYVRAVAYLEDGTATEDLVFINAPQAMGHLNINMVELYTTVSDRKGRPVEGLPKEAFVVREEGELHSIQRFERVQNLTIHAGVVVDASTSMQEELEEAVESAVGFFERVIRPRDRAAAVVFNDAPILSVPFTNRIEVLRAGLDGVESAGETALYDTLVFTLHYFAGIRGKRALILLSDGEDSRSRFSFSEALEFAQRSGVAVYTIALGLDRRHIDARNVLTRLANETGGRFFSISSARELDAIYDAIEQELRSQYLLVYQSSHVEGGDFRRVEVEVAGLKTRTIPGYYP